MARILITEDERLIAEDLRLILQSYGHEIIEIVSTGEKAIRIALQTKPDLIFMDIKLAGIMTGLDAAKEIVKEYNIPIIFCSAYSDDQTLLHAYALHPAGYISKPFNEEDIFCAIEPIITEKKNGREKRTDIYNKSRQFETPAFNMN